MKRLKTKKSKKFLFITPVFALIVGCGAFLLVHAFSNNTYETQYNDIPVSTGTVSIVDDSDPGFGKKEVSFVNDDADGISMLLRIGYSETWKDVNDNVVSNIYNGNNVVTKTWTSAFTNDFVDGNDGWYYYKKLLGGSNSSVQVITAIALAEPSYAVYNYDLNFRFEAIQPTAAAASALWSKTASIDSTTGAVTWTIP